MKPTTAYNLLAVGLALGIPLGWTVYAESHRQPTRSARGPAADGAAPAELTDARGRTVALRRFERIVSASIVADPVLWQLCEPERVVADTSRAVQHPLHARRYAGKQGVEGLRQIEQVLALRPDLVVISHFADARHIARLEDAGIVVFDLGEMLGFATLRRNIDELGALVGNRQGARRLGDSLRRRLDAVAASLGDAPRPRALYLSVYGTKLFGGTRGTSYYDVLTAAGLVDVGADEHEGWPELGAEDVLSMNPELIVTKRGMARAICRHPGLDALRACRTPDAIVGVTPVLIDDPGPAVLEAAEELFDAVHGPDGVLARRASGH